MIRKHATAGLVGILFVMLLFAVGCGGGDETTTTGAPVDTTAAPVSSDTATGGDATTDSSAPVGGPATGEPIKVGVIASLTGGGAAAAQSMVNALQLEVDFANANGGANGRPIELIILDDKTDATTAVSVATKLITQDKVTALLGPLHTPCALAVQPLAEKYEVPMLRWDTPTLDAPTIDAYWSFICSVGPADIADALTKQIEAEGWKNILAAADVLPPNFQALTLLEESLPQAGVSITVLKDNWQIDATDLTPVVNKIFAAYKEVKPDVVFIMSTVQQTPMLMKPLRGLGVTEPILSGPVSGHPAVFSMGPDAVEGLLFLGAGITNASELPDDYPNKQVMVDFANRFQAEFDEQATLFAGAAYDSFHILFEGLKAGGDDKAKIRDAIEALKDFPVSQGVVNYAPDDHQLHGGYNLWVIESGVFKYVRPLN